jgi:hypothetical protein
MGQELMRGLSVGISFSHFSNIHYVYHKQAQKKLIFALSMRIRNLCIH